MIISENFKNTKLRPIICAMSVLVYAAIFIVYAGYPLKVKKNLSTEYFMPNSKYRKSQCTEGMLTFTLKTIDIKLPLVASQFTPNFVTH